MSSKLHDSQQQEVWQETDKSDEDWNELVAKRLPSDLEIKAIELGAWSRQREVRSIGDLLRALLVLAALGFSFQRLAMWATLKGVAHMSECAWRKRMQRSAVWIAWLLCELLSVQSTPSWLEANKLRGRRILLIDATRLRTPGGTGDDVRLHWSYDLLSGKTQEVAISDRHKAEGLGWFKLQAGDITVTDAGYPAGTTVQIVINQHADAITRTTASNLQLETEKGEKIDLCVTPTPATVWESSPSHGMGQGSRWGALSRSLSGLSFAQGGGSASSGAQTATIAREAGKELQSGASLVGWMDIADYYIAIGVLV